MSVKREKQGYNMNILLYLLGRMVSDTGTSMQLMIMPLYIIESGGSAAEVGIFSFISLIPLLIIYPFAGVLGDRFNRKIIMVVTDVISAVVILGLAFLAHSGRINLALLIVAQIIISVLNGLFEPATRGMLPQLVKQEELTLVNSRVASLKSLSYLLGPVIGTALYSHFTIAVVFFVNGISFLLSGISEMKISYTHIKREVQTGIRGVFVDLSEGLKFVLENEVIRRLCYFLLITYFLVQPIFGVVLPLFFKTKLNYSDIQYGYLQSIIIAGMLLGSISLGVVFGKNENVTKPLNVGAGFLVLSILVFSILTFPSILSKLGNGSVLYFSMLAAILCLFSAAHMFISVPLQTYIQRETPNEYMARVFSLVAMISRGGTPFGGLIYGIILNRAEVHWTLFTTSLLMILVTMVLLTPLVKHNAM